MCELIGVRSVDVANDRRALSSRVHSLSQGATGVMVCVLAHVDLVDIFRLVGHHSATPLSLRKPSPGWVQHLQDSIRCFPSWKPGSKILNGDASSQNKRILAARQSFVAVEAHLLFINFSFL